ncbi:MAG: helix-turn-helix domain-containing protein [Propionibacteriaceae bacterium]|nr:helix-turn-helix domain-containing protein [Propionibacteriaceae bacterium]
MEMQLETEWGFLRFHLDGERVKIGHTLVPELIMADLPGGESEPSFKMKIKVIDGSPQCTKLTIKTKEGGRGIQNKDLKISLDQLVKKFAAMTATQITHTSSKGSQASVFSLNPADISAKAADIGASRVGSRRKLTRNDLERVAAIYKSSEFGPVKAVADAFGKNRRTAARYIAAARDAGLLGESSTSAIEKDKFNDGWVPTESFDTPAEYEAWRAEQYAKDGYSDTPESPTS